MIKQSKTANLADVNNLVQLRKVKTAADVQNLISSGQRAQLFYSLKCICS